MPSLIYKQLLFGILFRRRVTRNCTHQYHDPPILASLDTIFCQVSVFRISLYRLMDITYCQKVTHTEEQIV